MSESLKVRTEIVNLFRRDLIGPNPEEADLASEVLAESPSRWYLMGFLAPADAPDSIDGNDEESDSSTIEERDILVDESDKEGVGGEAGDNDEPESNNSKRRFLPSSIGLTVMLPPSVNEIDAKVSWGDYVTEPTISESILLSEDYDAVQKARNELDEPMVWKRIPKESSVKLKVTENRGSKIIVPDSASDQYNSNELELETHSRLFTISKPKGSEEEVRVLTVFLVNRRIPVNKFFSDISYIFQARLELNCQSGFQSRQDIADYNSDDWDLRVADLHYRDVQDWAVGCNAAASWQENQNSSGSVTRVWTDPLPTAEVERVVPNDDPDLNSVVDFGMESLAQKASDSTDELKNAIESLPEFYEKWIELERKKLDPLAPRRKEISNMLIEDMTNAQKRISEGISILANNENVRKAFQIMNLAIAMAARRRDAGHLGDPESEPPPKWRPFQLAFILLNVAGLSDKQHIDRETADLLFFPTGGGKTEAYLGLAAFVIALRRIHGPGVLGAGVSVIMRYTLRLLTLDQLARASGVVCALELLRTDKKFEDENGTKLLGDWPIEIGLWVGSDASPNKLGGRGKSDRNSAVNRVRRFKEKKDKDAPAPLKACPWCGTEFIPNSFAVVPNEIAPKNMEIRCSNMKCDFTRERPLPIITVDEPIYRRLPAFIIATIDKFASLPWKGESGAFFGHVDRFVEEIGFYGASETQDGQQIGNGWKLDPPDLIIQDELHLISGPLGSIAGLYETAIDQLATRRIGERNVRPKIVASTATVRRATDQIEALFDRKPTNIFPPPGIDRTDSFFARTLPNSEESPGQLYVGIAAQGRGPKLVFLRSLTTMLAAGQSCYKQYTEETTDSPNPADPYMTALCYFNALRDLGGARRIVEDQIRDRTSRYGSQRYRISPDDKPFEDREIREPLELTSRVSTDQVAMAKQSLEKVFGVDDDTLDVALATNMISVGLDITRLGLMLVQGQPKTAAEYIQATSRVGRDISRPGLVFTVLNIHRPRDRMHFQQFNQFHQSFYRSVEATSVTPWAFRALDRSLAAVVVSAIRHLNPDLSPEESVILLENNPQIQDDVRKWIIERAKNIISMGECNILEGFIEELLSSWIQVVKEQTETGSKFKYAEMKSPHRLLHTPLEPGITNISRKHRLFTAGRSMRDVEASVALHVKSPEGHTISTEENQI